MPKLKKTLVVGAFALASMIAVFGWLYALGWLAMKAVHVVF